MERIARCAQAVWKTLGGATEINILSLSERLGERSTLTYQALGWLAREGKIRYEQRGDQVYVSLTDAERLRYRQSVSHGGTS